MSQVAKKKTPVSRSKVVKMPEKRAKKKKGADPFCAELDKAITASGLTVARMARDAGVDRSNVYKWRVDTVPSHKDRVKLENWMYGGNTTNLKKTVENLQVENQTILRHLAKLMVKGTTQSVADALASLKADIELAKTDSK